MDEDRKKLGRIGYEAFRETIDALHETNDEEAPSFPPWDEVPKIMQYCWIKGAEAVANQVAHFIVEAMANKMLKMAVVSMDPPPDDEDGPNGEDNVH